MLSWRVFAGGRYFIILYNLFRMAFIFIAPIASLFFILGHMTALYFIILTARDASTYATPQRLHWNVTLSNITCWHWAGRSLHYRALLSNDAHQNHHCWHQCLAARLAPSNTALFCLEAWRQNSRNFTTAFHFAFSHYCEQQKLNTGDMWKRFRRVIISALSMMSEVKIYFMMSSIGEINPFLDYQNISSRPQNQIFAVSMYKCILCPYFIHDDI